MSVPLMFAWLKKQERTLFLFSGALLLIFALYAFCSESFQLSLIPQSRSGLIEIGQAQQQEGEIHRQLINDVLLYPLKAQDFIYLGDLIKTGKSSNVQIQLSGISKARIHLEAETQAKLRMKFNKPMIMLQHGLLDIEGDSTEEITVSSGMREQTLQVKKGMKVTVERQDDGDFSIKYKRTDLHNDRGLAQIGQSSEQWVNNKNQDKTKDSEKSGSRPLQYPYPQDQTVFLSPGGHGEIRFFPSEKCLHPCRVKIVLGSARTEFLSKDFPASSTPVLTIPYLPKADQTFLWSCSDGQSLTKGQFSLKPLSPAEMKRQIQEKHAVVILSDL